MYYNIICVCLEDAVPLLFWKELFIKVSRCGFGLGWPLSDRGFVFFSCCLEEHSETQEQEHT